MMILFFFIDEIHTIVGAGGATGSLDASNMFKPALARGEIQCIGQQPLTSTDNISKRRCTRKTFPEDCRTNIG
jgi:ATP-dependent Clp protease ATP-binding subunit ClpC